MRLRTLVSTIAACLGLLALVCGAAASWWWHQIQQPFQGYRGTDSRVEIRAGTGATEILDMLADRGVVANAFLARFYLVYVLGDPSLHAGEYHFSGPLSTPQVLDKLVRGQVVTYSVTLVEGLTLEETAEHLAAEGFGNSDALLQAMRRGDGIADWDSEAPTLEGYLFPDTYSFARGAPEEVVVSTLLQTFRQRFDEEVRPLLTATEPQDMRDLVTLASIVEKEAQSQPERPIIAGTYANRLRRRMGLYADPTIIYALKQLGRWDGNLRRKDLKLESPYNTYLYPGLPPGPICSPGLASLKAAAQPADVPYFFFVSRNDGSHVFSRTLAEHNANVNRWQKQYWRERWAQERKKAPNPPGQGRE